MPLKPLVDCQLYAFIDTAYLAGRDPAELARQLCGGGAELVQLRAKDWPVDRVRRLADQLQPICQAAGVWLVVNDHPEAARSSGAPLCHLGQEDFFDRGFTHTTEVFGGASETGLGLSTHSPDQAERAQRAQPAYVAVGPVFATPTKPGRPAVTLDYVRWAAVHLSLPWFAIGGITLDNLGAVMEAGANRVCVVSSILRASDVGRACREFRKALAAGGTCSLGDRDAVNGRRQNL
jgi:thiamine-phosphate pyrophosphorylase